MAKRGVFIPKSTYPYFEEVQVEFDWFGGFAKCQKRKCVLSVHMNFLEGMPDKKVLEISSSSTSLLGNNLSAMQLRKFVPSYNKSFCLESVFQTSRIYSNGAGHFWGKKIGRIEYVELDGWGSKKVIKDLSEGYHSYEYMYEGFKFPAPDFHISLFYDYIYLNALLEDENSDVREELIKGQYTAFTDMATKSLNNQARSCAIFVSLYKANLLDKVKNVEDYLALFRVNMDADNFAYADSYKDVVLLNKKGEYTPKKQLPKVHDKYAVEEKYYTVNV